MSSELSDDLRTMAKEKAEDTAGVSSVPKGGEQALRPTLRGNFYVDDQIFRREQEQIFAREWVCTARASELAEPGSFETFDIAGENIIIVRGRDGAIRAFLNVCRHRGSRICLEKRGQVSGALRCPYHSWVYSLDGKLAGAPHLKDMGDVDRVERGLIGVQIKEWLGYVWICLSASPPFFEESIIKQVNDRLGDPGAIGSYEVERLAVGRRIEYEVKANWKLFVENYLECYHCSSVHPEFIAVLPEYRMGQSALSTVGWGPSFGEDVQGFTFDGRPGLDPLPGVMGERLRRYYGVMVKPQAVVNLVPDHVIFHRLFPIAPDRTRVLCDWLFDPQAVESGRDLQPSIELFSRINDQDFGAIEACQPAMSSRAYRDGGVYVPAEHHIVDFNRWVEKRVSEAG